MEAERSLLEKAGVAPKRKQGPLRRRPVSAPNAPSSGVNAGHEHASVTRLTTWERIRVSEETACRPLSVHEVHCERCVATGIKYIVQPGAAGAAQASCQGCKKAVKSCSVSPSRVAWAQCTRTDLLALPPPRPQFLRHCPSRPPQTQSSLEPAKVPISAKRKARLNWEAHHIETAPRKTRRSKRPTNDRRRRDHSSDSGSSLPTERNQKRSCMSDLQSPTKVSRTLV